MTWLCVNGPHPFSGRLKAERFCIAPIAHYSLWHKGRDPLGCGRGPCKSYAADNIPNCSRLPENWSKIARIELTAAADPAEKAGIQNRFPSDGSDENG